MSINPVIISLKDFDFLDGLEKLSQLYEQDGLSKKVEVSFNLFFRSSSTPQKCIVAYKAKYYAQLLVI
jgi:hypothetical protein